MDIKVPVHEGWIGLRGGSRMWGRWAIAGEVIASNPDIVFSREMTPAEKQAEQELEKRQLLEELAAAKRQPDNDPEKIYAQVVVNGKAVATIYESGVTESEGDIPGLTEEGHGLRLAKARLKDILQVVHGQVKYSNFLPTMAERSAPDIKNLALEAARSRVEALEQALQALIQDMARTRLNLSTPLERASSEEKSVE
jgi:two-component sensor histidine kinase